MIDRRYRTVMNWRTYECISCGATEARLDTDGGSVAIRVTPEEAIWCLRGRHPAYAPYVRPLVEALAEEAFRVEIRADGDEGAFGVAIKIATDRVETVPIPVALALLLADLGTVPCVVDRRLLLGGTTHFLDSRLHAFQKFIQDVTPQDFVEYQAHERK